MSATTARSVLGPLTTTYIAPGICSNYAEIPGNGESWQAQGCANGDVVDTSSCWPPALVSAPEPPYYGWGFYSPGLVCPSGYASACAAALNTDGSAASVPQTSSFGFQFPLIPGETAVGCCPNGFRCAHNPQTCVSILTSGTYLAGICQSEASTLDGYQYVQVPGTSTFTFASTTIVGPISQAALLAPLFQLNWQSSDLPITTTSSASSSHTTPTSVALTTTATATVTAPIQTTNPTPGLSIGAKVAVGVVIPVAVLAIVGVMTYCLFRRRRQNRAPTIPPWIELEGSGDAKSHQQKPELDATGQPSELGTDGSTAGHKAYRAVPHELDASGQ